MVNSTITRKMARTDNSQVFVVNKNIKIFKITNSQRGKRRRSVEQTKLQTTKMGRYKQLVKSGYSGIS